MSNMTFPLLTANQIEARVATVNDKGCSLLLYKDARCDMNILDLIVGATNWQRTHSRDNANCTVSIWDEAKVQWISKEDTGTESNTEKEKGLASDSFKRACFNWGIGRELYTAPFIWVGADKLDMKERNGKLTTYDKFTVEHIEYDKNRCISALSIVNQRGVRVYKMGDVAEQSQVTQSAPSSTPPSASGSMTPEQAASVVLKLKKHEGKTIRQVYKEDREYLDWIMSDRCNNDYLKKVVGIVLGAANSAKPNKDEPDCEAFSQVDIDESQLPWYQGDISA